VVNGRNLETVGAVARRMGDDSAEPLRSPGYWTAEEITAINGIQK
jgi:hypothetical protein